MTDAEIAALPPHKRQAMLAKRNQRARAKDPNAPKVPTSKPLAAVVTIPQRPTPTSNPNPEPYRIEGISPDDDRALELYRGLQTRMAQNGLWGGDATHGILLSYVLATVTIERNGPHPQMITSQRQCWRDLKLAELPPEKVSKPSRFGGW